MTMTDTSDARATAERVPLRSDPRGLVLEPLGAAGLPAQRNVHLVVTEPGAVRGNHFHEHGTEVLVVLGPGLVRLREGGAVRDVRVPAGEAWRFLIPPRVGHALANTGPAPQIA